MKEGNLCAGDAGFEFPRMDYPVFYLFVESFVAFLREEKSRGSGYLSGGSRGVEEIDQ